MSGNPESRIEHAQAPLQTSLKASLQAPLQKPLFVYLHIPKTAGTSLSHVLRRKFTSESIALIYTPSECVRPLADHAAEIDDSIDCLSGHIDYGIHQHLSRECHYFSMLREPISRVVSHYHFTRSKNADTHPLGDVVEFAQSSSIIEYLQRFPAIAFEQIRVLSGRNTFDRQALDLAKDNLTSGRIKVGLTNDFFRSTEMIFNELELGYPRFAWRRKNSTSGGKGQQKGGVFDAAMLAELNAFCALDIELFHHAQTHHLLKMQRYQNLNRTVVGKARHQLFQIYRRMHE